MSVRDSHDEVAAHAAELDGKPLDRALLDLVAASAAPLGPIADLGCGPGRAAAHLASRGATALGVDSSPAMVERARARHPEVSFHVGDLRALDVPDEAWGGVVALLAITRLARRELRGAFAEFRRVLKPGGEVLVGFHVGAIQPGARFHTRAELEASLTGAALTPYAYVERAPLPGEADTARGYLLARRNRGPSRWGSS